MRRLLLFALLFALAGCLQNEPPGYEDTVRDDANAATERPGFESYGTMMGMDDDQVLLPVDEVVNAPFAYDDTVVRVKGTVAKVCQMKGCWVTLRGEAGAGGNLRVEVPRDAAGEYAYTFPKDLGPVEMVVEGTVEVREEDPEAVAHFEADGEEAIVTDADGSRRQVVLVASGALVQDVTVPALPGAGDASDTPADGTPADEA